MAFRKYTPEMVGKMTVREMKKAYTKLRKEIGARQKRLKLEGFDDKLSNEKFRAGSRMRKDEIQDALLRASRFVSNRLTTVKGAKEWRDKVLESLHTGERTKNLYPNINKNNFSRFVNFMNDAIVKEFINKFGSEKAAEMADMIEKGAVSEADVMRKMGEWNAAEDMEAADKDISEWMENVNSEYVRSMMDEVGDGTIARD